MWGLNSPPSAQKPYPARKAHTIESSIMFVQLTPDQIDHYWLRIKQGLEQALPPITRCDPLRMENIRLALLAGSMQSWISYENNGHGLQLYASVVTTIATDECSKVRNLEIYSLFGTTELIPNTALMEGVKALRDFARQNSCSRIIAFSDVERFKRLIEDLGGDTRYTFLALEV